MTPYHICLANEFAAIISVIFLPQIHGHLRYWPQTKNLGFTNIQSSSELQDWGRSQSAGVQPTWAAGSQYGKRGGGMCHLSVVFFLSRNGLIKQSLSLQWMLCFGISVSSFTCILFLAMGHSLMIFRYVTFKMAAWWPYWIFQFLGS